MILLVAGLAIVFTVLIQAAFNPVSIRMQPSVPESWRVLDFSTGLYFALILALVALLVWIRAGSDN